MTKIVRTNKKPAKLAVFPPWSPVLAIVLVVLVYFIGSFLGEILAVVLSMLQGRSFDESIEWMKGSTVARTIQVFGFYGSMTLLLYWFVRKYKVTFAQLGLLRPRLRDVGIALLAIVPYVLGYALLLIAATALFPSINTDQKQQLGFAPGQDTLALVLTFLSLVVLPPLVEELAMRGFLFTSLKGYMRLVPAMLLASVIFAMAHLQFDSGAPLLWVAAIDTFVLSIILCYMRYKTGSLWAGIILHALKNGVAFLSLFVFGLG